MDKHLQTRINRRMFQTLSLSLPAAAIATTFASRQTPGADATPDVTATAAADATRAAILPATPECGDDDDMTVAQTEGPFFTPDSPERTSLLEDGVVGPRLIVAGYVLTTTCEPVPGALLDFWQADNNGIYDNEGYTLRGHQFADDEGRYLLETILPGIYPGRTRHIHVKVQAPDGPVLTTQLYFPSQIENLRDGIYDSRLEVDLDDDGFEGMRLATFNFVVER